jgi:hypothetical protein
MENKDISAVGTLIDFETNDMLSRVIPSQTETYKYRTGKKKHKTKS